MLICLACENANVVVESAPYPLPDSALDQDTAQRRGRIATWPGPPARYVVLV
jgi:hypothetical protein